VTSGADLGPVSGLNDQPTDRLPELRRLADQTRQVVLEMVYLAGSGHLGSALSCVDILTVLKFDQMNWRVDVPRTESDVFVLSKGHAVPAWYATLMVSGELDTGLITTLRKIDSPLQGHPDRGRSNLVDVSTGALGQGLSIALGRAQGKRLHGRASVVYCLTGDGELQEGQVWEAVMYAGAHGLANVVLIIDANGRQNDGSVDEILPLQPLAAKLESFRWHVQSVDGHCHRQLRAAIVRARANRTQPSAILARTVKGYLSPGRVVLDGVHNGVLAAEEFRRARHHLWSRA
jgi:transketolase